MSHVDGCGASYTHSMPARGRMRSILHTFYANSWTEAELIWFAVAGFEEVVASTRTYLFHQIVDEFYI